MGKVYDTVKTNLLPQVKILTEQDIVVTLTQEEVETWEDDIIKSVEHKNGTSLDHTWSDSLNVGNQRPFIPPDRSKGIQLVNIVAIVLYHNLLQC